MSRVAILAPRGAVHVANDQEAGWQPAASTLGWEAFAAALPWDGGAGLVDEPPAPRTLVSTAPACPSA